MFFTCEWEHDGCKDIWQGSITDLEELSSHYEILIQSRSSIRVVFGKTSSGGFACMPDFQASCCIANLKDQFWNTERLVSALGPVDGITVASALYSISDDINI